MIARHPMASAEPYSGITMPLDSNTETIRAEWLNQLSALITNATTWSKELGWSTKDITVTITDALLGRYKAPALLLQLYEHKVLLEPVSHSAPGTEGVVDLYRLPQYDDIASLYLVDGKWQVHYMWPEAPVVATVRDSEPKTLEQSVFGEVLNGMRDGDG